MRNILHTTAYFPPIDYIISILDVDKITIEANENYQKRSYRNRTIIQAANGSLGLSIPVNKIDGSHTPINKIEIDYSYNWQHDHWQAIQSAYNRSPFFEYYKHFFEPFFVNKWSHLLELNTEILKTLLTLLSIQKPIVYSESFNKAVLDGVDYRDLYQKHKLGKSIYLIDPYAQVFDFKHTFNPNVSILDAIFNLGPETVSHLYKGK